MIEEDIERGHKIENIANLFDSDRRHEFQIFMEGIVSFIGKHPSLNRGNERIVHSFKSRLKDQEHLKEKIDRKLRAGKLLTVDNLFESITDLAGVRILHLFQQDFAKIDALVRKRVADGDWYLSERPKAYTWDPEAVEFFGDFDLDVQEKSTAYTSVHYLIRPKEGSPLCCELQVRTLFEEIWGEVDHKLNYPVPTTSVACREQLRVLSKIVGAGSRLLDSLQRVTYSEAEAAPINPENDTVTVPAE